MEQDGLTRWQGRKSHPPTNSECSLIGGQRACAVGFLFHLFTWGWEMSWSMIHTTEAAPHERRSHSPGSGVLAHGWHHLPVSESLCYAPQWWGHCLDLPRVTQEPNAARELKYLECGYFHLKHAQDVQDPQLLLKASCVSLNNVYVDYVLKWQYFEHTGLSNTVLQNPFHLFFFNMAMKTF